MLTIYCRKRIQFRSTLSLAI
uniref:Uncharacterized protein n=1 Tax=Arundo donax TaxID=35708 RepID=A0A0A9C1G2_ARUDO